MAKTLRVQHPTCRCHVQRKGCRIALAVVLAAGLSASTLQAQQISVAKTDGRSISNLQVTVSFTSSNRPFSASKIHGAFDRALVDGLRTTRAASNADSSVGGELYLKGTGRGPAVLTINREEGAAMNNLRLTLSFAIDGSPAIASYRIGDFTNGVSLALNCYGGKWDGHAWTGDFLKPLDSTARLDPSQILVDGFEGWGTSLCWWANVVAGYPNRDEYADLAFTFLRLNIVRYNISGGEGPEGPKSLQFRVRMPGFQPARGQWNWNADRNQRWMLKAAVARGVRHVEAFANSPPYWMTVSGSVTGARGGTDNLRPDSETDFAVHLAEVLQQLGKLDGITFNTIAPMNEPSGNWWTYGGRFEGCHMSAEQQARVINLLRAELDKRGLAAGIAGPEENDEQSAINSLNAFDPAALNHVARIATHTYGANNPGGLNQLAASLHKPLWHTEYGDDDPTGLRMARRIRDDLIMLRPKAWCYWQTVDYGGWGLISNPLEQGSSPVYTVAEKLYAFAQFTRFIRPGCQILGGGDDNSVAGYDPVSHTLAIVTVNDGPAAFTTTFDLNAFASAGATVERYRTSASEKLLRIGDATLQNMQFSSTLTANSVTTHLVTNVMAGPHITSVNDNTTGTGLNQFQYHGPSSQGRQSGAFEGDNHWSAATDSHFQVDFEGTQIKLYGAQAGNCGIAAVSIDDGPATFVDQYAPDRRDNKLLWTSPTLPRARHALKVRVTGTRNTASSANNIVADRVDIIPWGVNIEQESWR